jgi:hypothetical protein
VPAICWDKERANISLESARRFPLWQGTRGTRDKLQGA